MAGDRWPYATLGWPGGSRSGLGTSRGQAVVKPRPVERSDHAVELGARWRRPHAVLVLGCHCHRRGHELCCGQLHLGKPEQLSRGVPLAKHPAREVSRRSPPSSNMGWNGCWWTVYPAGRRTLLPARPLRPVAPRLSPRRQGMSASSDDRTEKAARKSTYRPGHERRGLRPWVICPEPRSAASTCS